MSIIGTVHEDVTTEVLGKIGTFQWMMTVFTTALMASSLFNQHEDMFLMRHPSDIVCLPPSGYQTANNACYVVSKNTSEPLHCFEWNVRLLGMVWLKKSFQMTCDDEWKLFSTAMICRLGVMFGYVIYGLVADSFGRKKAMIIDVLCNIVLRISAIFFDSESWFKLVVFVRSVLGCANNYMGLVLLCEIASNRWRSRLCLVAATPRVMALVCMVPISSAISNSESFSLVACVYDVLLIVVLRWTPESPQWLLFNNKTTLAERTLYAAAKTNNISLCSDFKIRPVNYRAYHCLDENQTCIGILSTHNTRVLILVCTIFWLLNCHSWSLLYSDVYFQDKSNYFVLKTLFCACAIGCLTISLSWKLQLRYLLMLSLLAAGTSELTVMICKGDRDSTIGFLYPVALAARMIAVALSLTISPRLFATNVRATLIGCCQAAGQLGAIIGYLLSTLKILNVFSLGLLSTVATFITVVLCLILPDVDSREMPDVLQDMDYFSELTKPLRWATQKTRSPSHEEVELKNHSFGSRGRSQPESVELAPARPIGLRNLRRALEKCLLLVICRTK